MDKKNKSLKNRKFEILAIDSKFASIVLSAVESEDCFIQNLKELETVSVCLLPNENIKFKCRMYFPITAIC